MKRIISSLLIVCTVLFSGVFAETDYTNRDILEGIGTMFSTYGVYGDFDSEELYLDTLSALMDNHPELHDEILKTIMTAKDKYGAYYTKEEAAAFLENLSDSITGIGVVVTAFENNFIVSQVLPSTPAQKAGILVGDRIISADGVSFDGIDLDVATSYIKGPVGTTVSLVINRSGIGNITLNIVRQKIETLPVAYEVLDEKFGYIQIYSFSTNTAYYVNEALKAFKAQGIKDIILDVRNNGGGYLTEAVAVADLFLPQGKIITTEDHKVDILDTTYVAKGEDPKYNTVILINGNSASASEVLTAALMENNSATSIGENTYGKGTVQVMGNLPDGAMIKYTTAFYLTPTGRNINDIGIYPNIYVENTTSPIDVSQFTEVKYQNTYSLGMTSPEIKATKEMLKFLDLYQGEVNEYYDENLKIAIIHIQKSTTHLSPNGILDPMTQLEIYKILNESEVINDDQLNEAKIFLEENEQ